MLIVSEIGKRFLCGGGRAAQPIFPMLDGIRGNPDLLSELSLRKAEVCAKVTDFLRTHHCSKTAQPSITLPVAKSQSTIEVAGSKRRPKGVCHFQTRGKP